MEAASAQLLLHLMYPNLMVRSVEKSTLVWIWSWTCSFPCSKGFCC